MRRCAIFSCLGMGDGLIALVLSNNLKLNGYTVTTFHPFLEDLQSWFPHLPIRGFPSKENLEAVLKEFEHFFIIYEKSSWMNEILSFCQRFYPDKTIVLNPIATAKCDYPYWENGRFNGNRPFVDNLYIFCQDRLKQPVVTKSNGIVIPDDVQPRRFKKRVILHPTSSRAGKNWTQEKFLKVADQLQSEGFDPIFILTQKERADWKVSSPVFANMSELAAYVWESGAMIGNDSGIGHLASCLGLPTLTICRNAAAAKFWRPAWSPGVVLTPPAWIPNLKGLRWRDKHWKKWISVKRVLKSFYRLS